MEGVSGRAIAFAAEGARSLGLDPYALAREVPPECAFDLDRACGFRATLPWPAFVEFTKRIGIAVGGPEGLRELGRQAGSARSFRIFEIAGRALTDPADIYRMGVRWVGPTLFPMIPGRIRELADGSLEEILEIAPGFAPCPEIFHVMHGALAEMPRGWGHERAEVDLALSARSATFAIRAQAPRRGRLRRWLQSRATRRPVRQLMGELERQQESLQESYWEAREARDRIADQALELERVDAIGRRLSEHIEMDALADALVEVVTEDLGFSGVAFRFGPNQTAESLSRASIARAEGLMPGTPDVESPIHTAPAREGVFQAWCKPDAPPSGTAEVAVLRRLLPWIAIALDNALSYEDLQRHSEDLEERVRERTARLAATNHHLVREIEERERANEALLTSEAQLRASERLASVGTLAAGIAHEINNPIGSILAAAQYAQVLRRDHETGETLDTALEDIVRESLRCGGIVRSVLQFARDEHTDKWDCALDDVLRRAARLTATETHDRGAAPVRLTLPRNRVWAHVNPIQIEQAVVNLVRNAVESGSRDIHIRLQAQPERSLALIEVTDDGPGIPEAERVHIFEPFYTTRREKGGTGLGLSVVHGIASEHHGQLTIDASESGGLAVLLEIPTIPAPARPPDKQDNPA